METKKINQKGLKKIILENFIPSSAPQQTEDQLQAKCYQWFHNSFPSLRGLLFHIPNGGYRGKIEASRLKSTGVVPGIPDLCLVYFERTYFFELKTEIGIISQVQRDIHQLFKKHCEDVYVIRDFETFQDLINSIIAYEKII